MREIKFRALCEGKWVNVPVGYKRLNIDRDTLSQFTGLQDKNDVDIYEGDLVNVFFTSNDGEHIHDCVYIVLKGVLGGIELRIKSMLWESYGWNQDTLHTTLCERHSRLSEDYLNRGHLMIDDSYGENQTYGTRWKENDQSRYFEIIGNIHENPELLELK
jgi:uncharacterized phage protein (TIGR01671 family)